MSDYRKILKYCLSLFSAGLHHNKKSKVIYFHDVHKDHCYALNDHSMHIQAFLALIDVVNESGFSVVPSITEKKNQVMVCFDDGYRGIWDCHKDLVNRGVLPTVFVATSMIGKDNYLTSDEIRHLSDLGFSIQSHTVSHKPLTEFDIDHLQTELIVAKKALEQIVHKEVEEICFPLGYYNEVVLDSALKVYKRVYLSIPGAYWDKYDEGVILRVLCQDLLPSAFHLALIGGQEIYCNRISKQHYHAPCKK